MAEPSNDTTKKRTFLQRVKRAFVPSKEVLPILGAVSIITFIETPAFTGLIGAGKALLTALAAYGVGMTGALAGAIVGSKIGGQISKIFSKSEKAHAIGTVAGAFIIGLPAGFVCAHHTYQGARSLLSSDNKAVTEVFNKNAAQKPDGKAYIVTPQPAPAAAVAPAPAPAPAASAPRP